MTSVQKISLISLLQAANYERYESVHGRKLEENVLLAGNLPDPGAQELGRPGGQHSPVATPEQPAEIWTIKDSSRFERIYIGFIPMAYINHV